MDRTKRNTVRKCGWALSLFLAFTTAAAAADLAGGLPDAAKRLGPLPTSLPATKDGATAEQISAKYHAERRLNSASSCLRRKEFARAATLLDEAIEIARTAELLDPETTCLLHIYRSMAAFELKDTAAAMRSLATARPAGETHYGKASEAVTMIINMQSLTAVQAEDYAAARRYAAEALAIRGAAVGEHHHDTFPCWQMLAVVAMKAEDYPGAVSYLRGAYAAASNGDLKSDDRADAALALGAALLKTDELLESRKYFQEAAAEYRRLRGLYDEDTLRALQADAGAAKKLSETAADAEAEVKRLLEEFERVNNEVKRLESAGELEQAVVSAKRRLQVVRELFGSHRHETAAQCANTGRICGEAGRIEEAIGLLSEAWEIQKGLPERIVHEEAYVLQMLGKYEYQLGRSEAREHLLLSLKQYESTGALDDRRAALHTFLAMVEHERRDDNQSLFHAEKAIELYRKRGVLDRDKLINVLLIAAGFAVDDPQRRTAAAAAQGEEALRLARSHPGFPEETMVQLLMVCGAYRHYARDPTSIGVFAEAYRRLAALEGASEKKLRDLREMWAMSCVLFGDREEGKRLLEEQVQRAQAAKDPDPVAISEALLHLALVHGALGEHDAAKARCAEAERFDLKAAGEFRKTLESLRVRLTEDPTIVKRLLTPEMCPPRIQLSVTPDLPGVKRR